jgi:arylsulfatase A-like enzyme
MRFSFRPGVLLAVAILIVGAATGCKQRGALPDRNVILISVDSLRWDHVGAYGYEKPTTPRIDAWAQNAMKFEYAYATSPWTLPSHASMFTGLYADTHGVRSAKSNLRKDATTLAGVLADGGVQTAGIVCAPLLKKRYGMHNGFEHYDTDLIGENALDARAVKVGPKVTGKALAWLDDHGEKPFFLFLHYWDVHYDYNPPQPYLDLFDADYQGKIDGRKIHSRKDITPEMNPRDLQHIVALYDGEIRYTDDAIGDLLDGLAARGLDQNTAIILTSDHGEEFLDHGGKGHTRTCYEEVVRIPYFVKAPWLNRAGVSREPVSLVDIFPTTLGLLEQRREGLRLQGSDLSRVIERGGSLPPRAIMTETRRGQPIVDGKSYRWTTLLGGDLNKIHRLESSKERLWMLFDVQADPLEQRELAEEKPEARRKLGAQIEKRLRLHEELRKIVRTGGEADLDPELAATLKGLGYIQ